MEVRDVSVPLITLIPISFSTVSAVKFVSELEIIENENDVEISFPLKKTTDYKGETETTNNSDGNAKIEITISPQENSEGLKKLIEGYEKILRSQIPN
jgi:hypothetical protein